MRVVEVFPPLDLFKPRKALSFLSLSLSLFFFEAAMLPSPQHLLLPRHAAIPAPMLRASSCSSSPCCQAAAIPRPRLASERRQQRPRGRALPPSSRPTLSVVFASSASPSPSPPSKAALLVAQGRAKYAAGDRMGALALFESALKQVKAIEN